MNLQDKIAVVTGGSSGLGQACIRKLKANGANVINWDQTPSTETDYVLCDVSQSESVLSAAEQTRAQHGTPRILIHCAGIANAHRLIGKHGSHPFSCFEDTIQVNLMGTFYVVRVLAELMMGESLCEEERGVIVTTASIAAFEGQIGQAAYSASKAGVIGMTLPLSRELGSYAIRINTIAPGLMATPLLQTIPETIQTTLAQTIPFPQRLGDPEEFASLAIHLCENPYLNGTVIRLDGALRLPAQ